MSRRRRTVSGGSRRSTAMPRSMLRNWLMAMAASRLWPVTSPITSAVSPLGRTKLSYQSPPTWAVVEEAA